MEIFLLSPLRSIINSVNYWFCDSCKIDSYRKSNKEMTRSFTTKNEAKKFKSDNCTRTNRKKVKYYYRNIRKIIISHFWGTNNIFLGCIKFMFILDHLSKRLFVNFKSCLSTGCLQNIIVFHN